MATSNTHTAMTYLWVSLRCCTMNVSVRNRLCCSHSSLRRAYIQGRFRAYRVALCTETFSYPNPLTISKDTLSSVHRQCFLVDDECVLPLSFITVDACCASWHRCIVNSGAQYIRMVSRMSKGSCSTKSVLARCFKNASPHFTTFSLRSRQNSQLSVLAVIECLSFCWRFWKLCSWSRTILVGSEYLWHLHKFVLGLTFGDLSPCDIRVLSLASSKLVVKLQKIRLLENEDSTWVHFLIPH